MAPQEQKKVISIYSSLSIINADMSGEEYLVLNEKITNIITDVLKQGRLSKMTAGEISILDDNNPKKAYLTNIANIMLTMNKITDPEKRKKAKVNIARFLQLYYEHPSIQKQAYVEHRMMNWADLLQQMMNPKFAFEESDLSTLLLSEAKRTAKLQEQPLTL